MIRTIRTRAFATAVAFAVAFASALALPGHLSGQSRITTPRQAFGHDFGEDYFLATYGQLAEYWRTLDAESDRMVVQEIGRTSEGRPHLMAIVTSPANHRALERHRVTSMRLALADGVSESEARAL